MPTAAWAALGLMAAALFHPHAAACPPIAAYTLAQEQALAASVSALKPDDPLVGAMADYLALRKSARACAGASK
jgi:hypothetical protein